MEDLVGAYRVDENGDIVPDENDEAMAKRLSLKKTNEEVSENA